MFVSYTGRLILQRGRINGWDDEPHEENPLNATPFSSAAWQKYAAVRESATSGLPRIGHFLLRFIPSVYESAPHPEKSWKAKAMLTKPWENLHLSMDPLDRLTNDVYDCVTDEALGAGDRWGARELGLLRQRGPAR